MRNRIPGTRYDARNIRIYETQVAQNGAPVPLEMVRRTAVAHESNLDENHGRYRFMNSSSTSTPAVVSYIVFQQVVPILEVYTKDILYAYLYDFFQIKKS